MDPAQPSSAIRIAIDLALGAALDPAQGATPELADEIDRQQQAFDFVGDLLGMHAAALDGMALAPDGGAPAP